ncbi:MAG TPA: hypothetical protein VHO67_21770 [Polyangia bacterium]|nr:hypothetical protein [Polyangia bacterium]
MTPLVVSVKSPKPRTTTWSVNYWMWSPSYGNDVAGTESLVAPLKVTYMRVGGYNNDANVPDPFDHAQLDAMVAYARAIGAEPILQVPVLGDTAGKTPTPDTAAEMVTYANVTKGYGIKYFSVGNEPDIYPDQASTTAPSRPGYKAADVCTTATAFVAAMKTVDPTIQIVGPDLAWKYQAGSGANDWLTPILQTCGSLFDVISIHRYPFAAVMATLPAAKADAASFRQTINSVRGIMQATGQGTKPLALTEMNVAYDGTSCVLDASPATVGGALWLADALGSAIDLGLWTSAVWDIADDEVYALGLIGIPPKHVPRPAYYAYQLYADHYGPTSVAVSSAPAGVTAYASRNAAADATDIIYVNWNKEDVGVAVQVTDLATPPATPTFRLPAQSLGAIEIPDNGNPQAWAYAEAERQVGVGPQPLAAGTAPAATPTGGAGGAGKTVGTNCPKADGGFVCPRTPVSSAVITTAGTNSPSGVTFGAGANQWGSYSYAAPGQTAPLGTATSDGNGLHIQGAFVPPVSGASNYMGFGLYYSSNQCLDATSYTGVQFEFSGSLGSCALAFGANFSGDTFDGDDPSRGGCQGSEASCYGPSADVTRQTAVTADAGGAAADGGGTDAGAAGVVVKVPFSKLTAGVPLSGLDPGTLVTVQWQLSASTLAGDAGGCAADFTVKNVAFYK